MTDPVLQRLPAGVLGEPQPGAFVQACRDAPDHLLHFLLNIGDGDCQLFVLPAVQRPGAGASPRRGCLVVDVGIAAKLPALIQTLAGAGVLQVGGGQPYFPVVVATHPHDDHVGGMPEFVEQFGDRIGDFWEPGFYHPSAAYIETMALLEDAPWITRTQPTSGTVRFAETVKITVLTPGVGLKSRFDTYGTDVNDASITVKIDYPATRVLSRQAGGRTERVYLRLDSPWSVLLGADAQLASWAQATVDFPELKQERNAALARELRAARGRDHLKAHVLKMPHHGSKHGATIELIERVNPWAVLVSSVGGGGRYDFPHRLAIEAAREAMQPSTQRGTPRIPDHQLAIHYTGGLEDRDGGEPVPLGTIAVMLPPKRGGRARLWRFGDRVHDAVDLDAAREMPALYQRDPRA